MRRYIALILLTIFLVPKLAMAQWQSQITALVQNGGVLAVDQEGRVLFAHNIHKNFIPASTLKVLTSLVALKELGEDFRFPTDLYLDNATNLYVKGYGDPFLVSEELALVAAAIRSKGIRQVGNLILDTSFYDKSIEIGGRSNTLNPYDAPVAALVANFNTININKDKSGKVSSAETQTPMTELTAMLAKGAPSGKSRISLSGKKTEAVLYVGYLLKAFLEENNIVVSGVIKEGLVNSEAKLVLTYRNSRKLKSLLANALDYSQNLVMNQVFLMLGTKSGGAPATIAKGRAVVMQFVKNLGLKNVNVEEGSGLSRENQISPAEMDKVLVAFFPYRFILPEKMKGLWAKTGTLNGVAALVGYFQSPTSGWVRFVILLNQGVNCREKIAKILQSNL